LPHLIKYLHSTVSYEVYGTGPQLLLAFPGYGKEASSLQILSDYFNHEFTIISIDVFFHGQSVWKEENPPVEKDWRTIIQEILKENGNPKEFSVFGYSIGGRVATYTAYLFSNQIDTLWLTAATGIGYDGFYNFAVNTRLGNAFFKRFVKKPGLIFGLIKVLNETMQGFIKRKIDTYEKRELLYKRWRVLKNFNAPTKLLKARLIENGTHVLLVYGKKDTVVSYKTAKEFAKGLDNVNLLLPDAGHHLFDDKTMEWVKQRTF
jgi:pimeloyl-ACP methyl ester carboxylesterase